MVCCRAGQQLQISADERHRRRSRKKPHTGRIYRLYGAEGLWCEVDTAPSAHHLHYAHRAEMQRQAP